jgi:hypothetical protein
MSKSKTIRDLVDEKKMSIAGFERHIGAGVGSIRAIIDKNQSVSGKILSKILNTFPEIDANWLITGEGNMYKNQNNYIALEIELEQLRAENKVLRKYLPSESPISIAAEKETEYEKS